LRTTKLRGDSKTALKWGRKEKVSGAETVCVKSGIEINESEFLSGILNWKADNLSRCIQKGKTVREVMIAIGYGDKPLLDLTVDSAACRPGVGIGSELEFRALWVGIRDASNELGMSE
jgi:hypothetical protein